MGSRGAAATLPLHLMVVATLALAAATLMSTAEAGCSQSMAQNFKLSNTSGGFRVPEGGEDEDGLYMGSVEVDEQGVEQYRVTFLGKGNTTLDGRWANNNVSRAATGGLGRKLLQEEDLGAFCDGNILDADQIVVAMTGLANHFGPNGNTVSADSVFYFRYECVRAYVCNFNTNNPYGTYADVIWAYFFQINEVCTVYGGGWYDAEATNSRTGRTYDGNTFCGGNRGPGWI